MATDFGSGVTRTLEAVYRQFSAVVWEKGKPPLDSELNLMSLTQWEALRQSIRAEMHSGFFMDPTRSLDDYEFNPLWSNIFRLGNPRTVVGTKEAAEKNPVVWANVNGWVVPVCGTDVSAEGDLHNVIKLNPPPASDTRADLVFLEVWQSRVDPNPSTANKPSKDKLYKYGNVKYGGTNLADDIEDPEIGFETTGRIQVQYRIRVHGTGVGLGSGVALDVYPDGLDDQNILGQGAGTSPVGAAYWTNMREELGDPGLWRAGDGDPSGAIGSTLGTIDGYTYAIPICVVFRRNDNVYVAVESAGNPNQNGAFDRNPGTKSLANPLTGAKVLKQAKLVNVLAPTAGAAADVEIDITDLNGSGLEDTSHVLSSTFLVIGEEVVGIKAVDVVNSRLTIPSGGRGRYGTAAVGHKAGTPVYFFNSRPDGLYADQVARQDVLDLRHACNPGDWDFHRLLAHNVGALAKGELRSTWKKAGAGDTEGVSVHEVDYLHADAAVANPNHTEALDGPDGIRTVFSDAAVIQPDVTLLLDNDATVDSNGVGLTTADQFDTKTDWDVGPDFKPVGFYNWGANGSKVWTNGSVILLFIGGEDGTAGARGTFRDGSKSARLLMPKEYWRATYPIVDKEAGNQHPITLRFLDQPALEAPPVGVGLVAADVSKHPGPMYPWREDNFERPFIALGGLLNASTLRVQVASAKLTTVNGVHQIDLGVGVDLDAAGGFFTKDAFGNFVDDPSLVTTKLLRGERTLYGMLTDNGRDRSGASSEVYVVLYGDDSDTNNNGAFRVVGAGTAGYTNKKASSATAANTIVVEPCSPDFTAFNSATNKQVWVEFRSPHHNAEDTSGYAARQADLAIVLTDLGGEQPGSDHPWMAASLGEGSGYDLSMPKGGGGRIEIGSKMVLSLTLMYHPGRGGMARIPDTLVRLAKRGGASSFLRQDKTALDTTFASSSGAPTGELHFPAHHIQTWNRLPARGWHAPDAPNYGGNVVGYTEQDRESEVFVDKGSKTVVFRPYRSREMTLKALTSVIAGANNLMGPVAYPSTVPKDGLGLFTPGKKMGFAVPREYMPRFGRQDIPNFKDIPGSEGLGTFLPGINHLFLDQADATRPVFHIIGGEENDSGGNEVKPLFFATGTPTNYGTSATSIGSGAGSVNNRPNYEARRVPVDIDTNINATHSKAVVKALGAVNSSDFGRGLKGIQLPPYLGIARLMGVYEMADYKAKSGRSFEANRYKMLADPAINLLREDADQQSLFILKDGARDLTSSLGDHTYIIPDNTLDLTRIPTYVEGTVGKTAFEDFEYVVEAIVFGFGRNWIDGNNFVLVRKFGGQGKAVDGDANGNSDGENPELKGVKMVLPCAAEANAQVYSAFNRTVYQGDVYMSRAGNTRTTSDYEHRYGQLSISGQNALKTPIQQFDAAGNYLPETPNERSFEVLASLDFYTTLGTGKIGGTLYPGTPLDVCFTDQAGFKRLPAASTSQPWRVLPRAFTEGQKTNTSRASATVELLSNTDLAGASSNGEAFRVRFGLLDGTTVDLYGVQATAQAALMAALTVNAEDTFVVDQDSKHADVIFEANLDFPALTPLAPIQEIILLKATYPKLANFLPGTTGVAFHPSDSWDLANGMGTAHFSAFMSDTEELTVRAVLAPTPGAFDRFADGDGANVREITYDFPSIAPGAVGVHEFTWTGVVFDDADTMVLVQPEGTTAAGIIFTGYVSAADKVTIVATNPNAGAIDLPANQKYKVTVLRDTEKLDGILNVPAADFTVHLTREDGDPVVTAQSFADAINAHSKLGRAVTAATGNSTVTTVEAVPVGAEGNGIWVAISLEVFDANLGGTVTIKPVEQVLKLAVPKGNDKAPGANVTRTNLLGGSDLLMNAGNGTSQLALTGMTERFPLGALLQDSDFLGENPLGDDASAMKTSPAGPRPIQTLIPLTQGGDEYTRFLGEPGELLVMADGSIATTSFVAYTDDTPTGTKKFRLFRGGGSAFVLSGDNPGGPIDWVSDTFPASFSPMLKGGVLACRAMLVRNFYEEAIPGGGPYTVSEGDEIQLVLLTHGQMGNGNTRDDGVTLNGIISPAGYGEGYAAADRYRIGGRPLFKGYSREVPDSAQVTLAVYPEDTRT